MRPLREKVFLAVDQLEAEDGRGVEHDHLISLICPITKQVPEQVEAALVQLIEGNHLFEIEPGVYSRSNAPDSTHILLEALMQCIEAEDESIAVGSPLFIASFKQDGSVHVQPMVYWDMRLRQPVQIETKINMSELIQCFDAMPLINFHSSDNIQGAYTEIAGPIHTEVGVIRLYHDHLSLYDHPRQYPSIRDMNGNFHNSIESAGGRRGCSG